MARARTALNLPPRGRSKVDWEELVRELRVLAAMEPGSWRLCIEGASLGVINTARQKRAKALQTDDGVIETAVRDSEVVDGKRVGNLWMRFVPYQESEG